MGGFPRVVSLLCLALAGAVAVEPGQEPSTGDSTPSAGIAHFELKNQTFFDGMASLSSARVPIRLGFEEVLRAEFADAPPPSPRFDLELTGATAMEIVQTLCALDTRYTWAFDGNTINVFPRAVVGDPTYLLNRSLDKLDVAGIRNPQQPLLAIARQLPPPREQIGYAQVGGDSSYAKLWAVSFEDLTVRQAINRLAAHMSQRGVWVFSGSSDFRSFAFFKSGFNPRPAPAPNASR